MSLCSMLDWNLRKPREEQVVGAPSSEVENQRNSINGSGSPSSSSSHLPTMMRFMTMNPPPPHQPYHILQHPHFSPIMSNNNNQAVAELTWANGNLSVHGHGHGPCTSSKPIWGSSDTLESIVHQATNQKNNNLPSSPPPSDHNNNNSPSHRHHHHRHLKAFSAGVVMKSEDKIINSDATDDLSPAASKSEWLGLGIAVQKRKRSESEPVHHRHVGIRSKMASLGDNSVNNGGGGGGGVEYSMCGSGKDGQDDTTVMTWASFESPRSLKTDEDSASHDDGSENRDEEQGTKREVRRSHSTTRQSKASASHNLSERRRRDRINQKMKALQRLVPNASKTDKASMLDEVIEYLKQLQAQVQMMSLRSNIPQLIMPNNLGMGMQQQLQMSLLTRTMGTPTIGVGLGMLNVNPIARAAAAAAAATFVPPPYMVPPLMPSHFPTQVNQDVGTTSTSVLPVPDPFCAYLAQNMDIERYNKTMTELHRQKVHQGAQTNRPSRRQGQAPPKGRRNLRK